MHQPHYFLDYDKVLVYYDNGQIELTRILSAIFPVLFSNLEFRKVQPSDYKLFQTADMLCTLELVDLKFQTGQVSKSERDFFHSYHDFKKNYLKQLRKKLM